LIADIASKIRPSFSIESLDFVRAFGGMVDG
jgi:hypothetical protein